MTFEQLVSKLRKTLPGIQIPKEVRWELADGSPKTIVARVPYPVLTKNLVSAAGASPGFYALAFAFWAEKLLGLDIRCHVVIENLSGGSAEPTTHQARAQLVLQELAAAVPGRLTWEADAGIRAFKWTDGAVVNVVQQRRTISKGDEHGVEHQLQSQLSMDVALMRRFRAEVAPVKRFRQQLPLGLFDGKKSKTTRLTPGGGAQVDLWGVSTDGKTFHAVELKALNTKGELKSTVGILSEAFAYARILQMIRDRKVSGNHSTLDALRGTTDLVFWLAAPEFHPLVYRDGLTPLEWVNPGLARQRIEFRIIPFTQRCVNGRQQVVAWDSVRRWPPLLAAAG